MAKWPWISNETIKIINQCCVAHLQGNQDECKWLSQAHNKCIWADYQWYWDSEASELEVVAQCTDQGHTFRMLWQAKAGPGYKSYLIMNINDNVLTTEATCLNHSAELTTPPRLIMHCWILTAQRLITALTALHLITSAEVRAAPRSLKNSHAWGVCPITAELLKTGGESLIQWLVYINQVWIHEELPDGWRWGVILSFCKCKGDKLICSNHRGIKLLNTRKAVHPCSPLQGPACHLQLAPTAASWLHA